MRKTAICLFIIMVCLISTLGVRADGLDHSEVFKSDEVEFQKMHTTAYCLHGVTANGGTTRPHIAACNPHLGEVATVYTLDGEYLGTFEITDTGKTKGLRAGRVIDVWFDTYEECKEWMRLTGGKVYVAFTEGEG